MENGSVLEHARNGRISAFDRTSSSRPQLGAGTDFDLGKSAWNSTSRLWGRGKSFLEDDQPTRPSPVRQSSTSSFTHGRVPPTSTLTPVDVNDENASQSKLSRSAHAANSAFASKPRGQPLSPTQQRQVQNLDSVADAVHGPVAESSLFAGSAPDVEDELPISYQSRQSRRAVTDTSRLMQSPTQTMNGGRSAFSPQIQAYNTNSFNANGISASMNAYEPDQDHGVNGYSARAGGGQHYLVHNGYLSNGRETQPTALSSGFGPTPPTYTNIDRPSMNGRADQLQSSNQMLIDEAVRSLNALSLDQAQNIVGMIPSQRGPGTHAQYQHNIQPMSFQPSTHPGLPPSQLGNQYPPVGNTQNGGSRLNPQAAPHYGGLPFETRSNVSPLASDYRSSVQSPYYPSGGAPPTGPQSIRTTPANAFSGRTSPYERSMTNRKLRNVDQYAFDQNMFVPSTLQPQYGNGYHNDMHTSVHGGRMNPLANPYMMSGHGGMNHIPSAPRVSAREPEQSQVVRSPLLEEFRMNNKSNRRFELKDIYDHVVEFSGDQHGSRFIQQKLETANSDEKEQIFKEIQPNLLQLMTDVFGNYVIQKMFEHGNQSQKKVLANQMKGHVMHLSMQMYGCRVVQKAFEHVLIDQQASLVKELDGSGLQILRVVKDQNGNHVVQKAIERIPGEHIHFIVNAHRGQMYKMSTHQYGCRVVQRMLEHCQTEAKRVILDELLEHISALIGDSYGNYVVQHIIENGEPQDRRHVVDIVLQQVLTFSKHKFASNIVEKSIDYADEDQRRRILQELTRWDGQAVSPVLQLMRDQYGNYVLQKVHAQLHGAELQALREEMRQHLTILSQMNHGKQVAAIQKLLYDSHRPPSASASSRSPALASTNASSTASDGGIASNSYQERK
ncbi:armadillo-type protein [Exophiala viscosa]|uniref:Pumilio homology domain family member 3 n=1 Tax=Exophiala viscosa TaxID=2486360 RepID=A0AAN6IHT4_9EURO|nr:armadillo-type protein [Exophiala viscosa]